MGSYIKWAFKVIGTALLLFWVFVQTDRESFLAAIVGADKWMLVIAAVPYVFSRIFGAMRLTAIINAIGVPLTQTDGLRLNWVSMFYGIFLPGGLGGDAYKLLALKRTYPGQRSLALTRALLWDRLTGLAVLAVLTVGFSAFFIPQSYRFLAVALNVAVCVVFWLATKRWIPQVIAPFWKLLFYSLLVQVMQIITMGLLLRAIGAEGHFVEHSLLFLLSSVASTFPISVGGVGIREVVFLKGSLLLGIDAGASVTATILFDLIVTLTAASGSLPVLFKKNG